MITARKLSNGVSVVMEKIPQVRSVAIGIYCGTGAVDEEKKYSGISHFVEHMMFKGTETRSALDIASEIDRIGGQMNAFTGKEATCYYVKTLSDNYEPAVDVLSDMLEHSVFEKKELDRERGVINEEIKMGKDAPDDVAHDTLLDILFEGSTIANSVTGNRTSLDRITHRVMQEYVTREYARGSIVISVAGNFDEDEICSCFEKRLNSLRPSKPERHYVHAEYRPKYRSVKKDIQQAHICLGTRAIDRNDERTYAFQILSNLFGGSMSSRLFQNIRERKGLAYSVFSGAGMFSHDGYFEIYAGVGQDHIRRAVEGIAEELRGLSIQPITQEELDSSREQLKSSYAFSQESTQSRMIVNGRNYLLLGKVFPPEEVIEAYDKVDLEALEEVRQMIQDFDSYSAVVVSNKRVNVKSIMEGASK